MNEESIIVYTRNGASGSYGADIHADKKNNCAYKHFTGLTKTGGRRNKSFFDKKSRVTKKKMKSLIQDERAVSNALEYAILISATVTLMVIVIVLFQGLVADAATLSVRKEYTGLGNQLSTAINDMYLSNCTDASRTFTIPYHTPSYGITFARDYFNRPAIKIYSKEVTVFVPVNIEGRGNGTITVAGNVSSITSTTVRITKSGNNITLTNV